jgi:hypothetical protein
MADESRHRWFIDPQVGDLWVGADVWKQLLEIGNQKGIDPEIMEAVFAALIAQLGAEATVPPDWTPESCPQVFLQGYLP